MTEPVPPEILALCQQITAKRPRTVVDHIIAHGSITTEELKLLYGYDHPPRAIRDVRECGIPIETFRVTSATGRTIAAYRFGDPQQIRRGRIAGRQAFSKAFKARLVEKYGARSTLTGEALEPRYLQIDHRVPYEVAGDTVDFSDTDAFMLLDASSQRAKSWSCEHCRNYTVLKNPAICQTCFWASPESYTHVAMTEERRLYLVWRGAEIARYQQLEQQAQAASLTMNDYLRQLLDQLIQGKD